MKNVQEVLRPLIALIASLLLIWMLQAAMSVLMPLTVAVLLVMLLWPLQSWLERRLPCTLSVIISVMALILVCAAIAALLWLCGNAVAAKVPEYQQRFNDLIHHVDTMLSHHPALAKYRNANPDQIFTQVMHLAGSFAVATYQIVGAVILIVVYVVLILIEVHPLKFRLQKRFEEEKARRLAEAATSTTSSIRRFLLMRTLTCGVGGVLTGLFTWAIGLDLALVWAVLAFILNYVPVFGAIVAVIPPTLVALIEPGHPWLVFVTLGGLTVIHIGVGNYLDPLLQGRYLSLPPLVVFFSLVFWSWLWGIPGAVISLPLTVGIIITCEHFDSTRWVARLLLNHDSPPPDAA